MRISDWSSDVCSSDLGLTPINASASPPAQPVACTFNGTPKASIPGFQIKVYQGSTDVSALASYGTVEASGISGAEVDSDGTVTVTGLTAEAGYVEVPMPYGGLKVTVRVERKSTRLNYRHTSASWITSCF